MSVHQIREKSSLEKNSEFRVIVYCPVLKNDNSELGKSTTFTELLKYLLTLCRLWLLEETRQTWTMFSKLKVLIDSEKFRVIVFRYTAKTITRNSEFSLSSMIPHVKVKFRVIWEWSNKR